MIISESSEQVSRLFQSLEERLGQSFVGLRTNSLVWSFLDSADSLADMAEQLPDISMMMLSEATSSCEYCESEAESQMALVST